MHIHIIMPERHGPDPLYGPGLRNEYFCISRVEAIAASSLSHQPGDPGRALHLGPQLPLGQECGMVQMVRSCVTIGLTSGWLRPC